MAKQKIRAAKKRNGAYSEEDGEEPYVYWGHEVHELDMSFTQFYHWTLSLLCRLTKCASDLVMYMSIHMDSENDITFIKAEKEKFIAANPKPNGTPYEIRSVDNALMELKKKRLIRDTGSKGSFRVNPKYFFKDNAGKRKDMVVLEIEYEQGKQPKLKVDTK